jgi:FKBP12-rapamycin complex-associated protein
MLLSACLDIIKTREKSPDETYRKLFDEARSGLLRASSTDTILGSLLAFGAMIQNQQIVRYFRGAELTCIAVDGRVLQDHLRAYP